MEKYDNYLVVENMNITEKKVFLLSRY